MLRRVFHARLRHFVVQAERLIDPTLAIRPIAVITSPAQNGTILDLSPEAFEEGLIRGMRVSLARKVSRRTVLLPFNAPLYQKVQSAIMGRLGRFSPLVEPAGYGSYFLDMSGMMGLYRSYSQAGHRVVQDVIQQIDLTPQVGIGRNKLVSAIATKLPPEDLVREVPQGEEGPFLAPLRSHLLPVSHEKPVRQVMADLNLLIVQDIQRLMDHLVRVAFGVYTRQVLAQASGIDTSVVRPAGQGAKRMIERYILPEDTNDEDHLLGAVQILADTVGFQLRRGKRVARKVTLMVHYTDGYEHRATGRLLCNDAHTVNEVLTRLYTRANRRRQRVRSITVDAGSLEPFARQMTLFERPADNRNERLSRQLDRIRTQYGAASIRSASTLG